VKHVSGMAKLIPSLSIALKPRGGTLWLWGGAEEKEKKGGFVTRKETSNRKDIYKAAFGYCSLWKEFVIMAIYKCLKRLINHGVMVSQSEAMTPPPQLFPTLSPY
jgi:hypothetical protein